MPASGEERARWGFHRLGDQQAARLVQDAGIRSGDLVLDIGAGTGALTAALVAAGARVIAVELHPDRLHHLRHHFAGEDVVVVRADAADLRLPRRPFKVVANPPFAVTALLLRRLLHPGSRLVRADLVLPRPVVARYVDGRARGAVRWSSAWSLRPGPPLRRSAFRPPSPVDTQVLVIEAHRR